jgi:integrase
MANVKRGKSTRKFPKGRWEVRWRTPEGKHRTRTFDRREDADRYAKRVDVRIDSGDYIDREAGATPYRVVAEEWLSTLVHVKPRTLAGYRAILNYRLLPEFGDDPVSAITTSRIRGYLARMANDGRRPQTIRNVFFVLQSSLHVAVENRYLLANPAVGVSRRLPKATGVRFAASFLTPPEIERLADACPVPVLIRFAAYTGARAGEIVALRVRDVDFLRREFHIRTSKTGDGRTVALPPFLVDQLAAYLAANPRPSTAPLFDFPPGPTPTRQHNAWYTRVFKPAATRAGFPSLRFHDLRHTAASLMIDSGANPKAVADRLGHRTVTMTLNRYAHLFAAHDERVTDGLERAYREAQ